VAEADDAGASVDEDHALREQRVDGTDAETEDGELDEGGQRASSSYCTNGVMSVVVDGMNWLPASSIPTFGASA
jgi:hypothetical protein